MLLWVVKRHRPVGRRSQQAVDLAGHVALQAANDLWLREPLGGPPSDIVPCAGIPAQPAEGQQIERPIGVAITAAVESMAGGPTRRGGQRRDPTQAGKGALAPQ